MIKLRKHIHSLMRNDKGDISIFACFFVTGVIYAGVLDGTLQYSQPDGAYGASIDRENTEIHRY